MVERFQSKELQCPLLWHANGIGALCRCLVRSTPPQEDVDREVRVGHMIQHRDLGLLLQLAEDFVAFIPFRPIAAG